MLSDLGDGLIDGVIVYNLDRLHRQPAELEEFFSCCDRAGVEKLASVSGEIDLATHDGRFHARILGAVSRKESDDKSRRSARKALELAEQGRPSGGGCRGFGYDDDCITIREDEARVIRECAQRFLAGESIRSISGDLNERGIKTSRGGEWGSSTLRRMLNSARISGRREHHGEIVADGQWDGIITPAQSDRIRAVLADPMRRTRRTPRRYLLAGILRCGRCGLTLHARPRSNGERCYVCTRQPDWVGCGKVSVTASRVEAHVTEAVLYRLDTPDLFNVAKRTAGEPESDAISEVRAAEAHRDELASAYAERLITMAEWLKARVPIEKELQRAQTRIARETGADVIAPHIGAGADLREAWSDLPLSRQSAIVGAVIDHVVVNPVGKNGGAV